MGTVNKWSSVGIAMQSALGADKTITAISKATAAVVTATHDFIVGDYVVFKVLGMSELNNRAFRVTAISTTVSFTLTGVDSTLYDTFTSGTVAKATLGTSLATVLGVTPSGGEWKMEDVTTIHDDVASSIPIIASSVEFDFEHIWDVADAGLIAMQTASNTSAERVFLFSFPSGQKMVLNGYVGASLVPAGSAQAKVTTKTKISARGLPMYYTT